MIAPPRLHVTWFVDPNGHPVDASLILSWRTALTLAACAVALGGLWLAQRLAGDPGWPRLPFLDRMAFGAPTLVAVQAAVTLVYYGVEPALLSPAGRLDRSWPGLLVGAIEIAVAFSFITGLLDWAGAAALAVLVLAGFAIQPPLDAIANLYWFGIATTVLFIGRQAAGHDDLRPALRRLGREWAPRALVILRVAVGIAVIAPALREKIWSPGIGTAFLHSHQYFNFPHALGLTWFTDDVFVLAAGIAEAVIGVLLVSGLLTRVVILAMFVPFNVTVPFLPSSELLGHLPIFAVMYALLVYPPSVAAGVEHRSRGRAAPA